MKPRLLAIVGPTGVGKSALAVRLARSFDIEVVNADSRLVYQGMDIGTAKPSVEDRAHVIHHVIDVVAPDGQFSLATFLDLARRAIADVVSRQRLPVVVGGTGQYVWGLLEHWQVPAVPPDSDLRRRLEQEPARSLFDQLRSVDPVAARQIGPRNVRRIVRALEVYQATGVPISRQQGRGVAPFDACVLGLTMPRQDLYRRLDARTDAFLAGGWLEEVRRLMEQGHDSDLPSMSSTGYREVALYLRGRVSRDEAVRRIKAATHRLVRHQCNWFRLTDPRIRWLHASGDPAAGGPQAEAIVHSFLTTSQGTAGGAGGASERAWDSPVVE